MSSPHASPDYTPCFETFCKNLVQSGYVLLADQHRWAFPPLDEPNLRWQAYKPSVPKSGNKSDKAAVPAYTWGSYNDKLDKYELKVSETPCASISTFGTSVSIHQRYEMMPKDIRDYVACTPNAFPMREEDWTKAFLGKTVKPYIDSGRAKEVSEMGNLKKKMKKTIAAVNTVSVKAVKSSKSSKSSSGSSNDSNVVCGVCINGKTFPFPKNDYSKEYRTNFKTPHPKGEQRWDYYRNNKFKLVDGKPIDVAATATVTAVISVLSVLALDTKRMFVVACPLALSLGKKAAVTRAWLSTRSSLARLRPAASPRRWPLSILSIPTTATSTPCDLNSVNRLLSSPV